jgi:hypothetical protein
MDAALNATRCDAREPEMSTPRRASQAAAHLAMRRLNITTTPFARGLAAAGCLIIGICAANAQASRTWVSALGDEANPCTHTAPCRTFAEAIAKTTAGGEIDVLDPGDFGTVSIDKAITIDGGGGQVASVTVAGAAGTGPGVLAAVGISVAAGANDVVTLRNLRIKVFGYAVYGIWFRSGAAIHIQNCYVLGFGNHGYGIGIEITGAGQVHIGDTIVSNNEVGIRVRSTAPNRVLAALLRVQINNNFTGLGVGYSNGRVSITDSQVANNSWGIASSDFVIINGSAIVNNFTGLAPDAGLIVVGNSTIAGNEWGVDTTFGPGTVLTNGNNSLISNFTSDGTFSGTAPLQ